MTPEQLIEQHVVQRLLLTNEESIDYTWTPNYKTACVSHRFYVDYDLLVEEYYWDKNNSIPMDSEERDWFKTEEAAWIACAKENQIEPAYLYPLENVVISQWLHERLDQKGQPVAQYKSLYVWGRPTSGSAIKDDSVIVDIAKENTVE